MNPFNPYPRGSKIAPSSQPAAAPRGSKIAPASTNRTIATAPAPQATPGKADDRILIYTFLTKITTDKAAVLYNGDSIWRKLTLTLETAGPVAVGQLADITPVLSGKGQLLTTGTPTTFNIAKGDRLYVASTSVNRISVVSEALPWMENITGIITSILGQLGGTLGGILSKIA